MTTYYVDTASSGGDGTTQATSGANAAWATIASVNAASFNTGDSILFKRGCTWRETLTVPSSGSSGNPITFGAYGTGADPIISGADLATGWASAGYNISTIADFVTALGGDAVVAAIYDARYGITASGGYVDSWDDARGASGYGPALAQTLTKRPAYDATNKILTFDGSNDQLTTATFAGFNLSTDKSLVVITAGVCANYRGIASVTNGGATKRYLQIGTRATSNHYFSEALDGSGTNPLNDSAVAQSTSYRLVYVQNDNGAANGNRVTVADSADVAALAPTFSSDDYFLDVGSYFEAVSDRWAAVTVKAVLVIEGTLTATQIALLKAWAYNQHGAVMVSSAAVSDPSDTWSVALADAPNAVAKDGALLKKGASAIALTEGQWFHASGTLYLNQAAGNPDTEGNAIEVSTRTNCVDLNGQDFLTIDEITCSGAEGDGIYFSSASHDVTIQNCTSTRNGECGLAVANAAVTYNVLVTANTISWNGASGLRVQRGSHDWTVSYNQVYRNCQINVASEPWDYTGGIRFWERWIDGTSSLYNIVVEHNTVYDNGKFADDTYFVQVGSNIGGIGIWFDVIDHASGGNIIRYNNVYGNSYAQVNIEHSQNVQAYYNLIHDSAPATTGMWVGDYTHASTRYNRNNTIYNNVIYNNTWYGLRVTGASDSTADSCTGNLIKNNILIGNTLDQLFTDHGGENDGTVGSGNVYANNQLGTPTAGHFVSWGGADKDTLGAFNGLTGVSGNLGSDPLLADAAAGDFRLTAASPCINAGVDVGLTEDYDGRAVPNGPAPEIGAHEYYGGGGPGTGVLIHPWCAWYKRKGRMTQV